MSDVSGNPAPDTDDLIPVNPRPRKKKGAPIQRTAKQQAQVERAEAENALAVQRTEAKAAAATLAQVVNLTIAGHSYEDIAEAIGATASEVETMITSGADRYVRTQPALRTWVRKWISGKYTTMIEADWDAASNPLHPEKLENQDRVIKMLTGLERLHGAAAPTQAEVKIEHSADDVERLVQRLSERQGQGYDPSIFDGDDDDVVDIEVVVHDAAASSLAAIERAADESDKPQPDDEELRT